MDIPGPVGALEADFSAGATPARGHAVLCHPHPLYGGSMHDAVLGCVSDALLSAGVSCLKFNFRGVGASEGRHDGRGGEVEDLGAALAWLLAEPPDGVPVTSLWLCGYSFGAHVVWQYLARQANGTARAHALASSAGGRVARVLLVAPPVGPMAFPELQLSCPVDLFIGTEDEFADPQALAGWGGVRCHRLTGANHFFAGQWDLLTRQVAAAIR